MTGEPVRVAFLLPHLDTGGAERVVLNWLGALDRRRFRPMLFLTAVRGAFLERLPDDVVPTWLGANRALRLPGHIARTLADRRVAVAYSATNAMNMALLAAPRSRHRAARIVSEHTPPGAYLAEAKLPFARRAAMRLLYPRADAIAVPTDAIGRELETIVGRPLPLTTLPNPVIDTGIPPPREGAPPEVPHVVAAGRLVPAKGFDILIDAAARLASAGVRFHLTIFGEGPLRGALATRIAAAGIGGIVRLAGQSDRLGQELAASDLVVVPSRREGFGNVVIEAMAAGAPVLATRGGGPESLIRDGVNGFLAPAEDAAALADAMARLLADPSLLGAVRAAGRETASGFGIAASTRALEELLTRLVRTRSTPD